jgi:hypothetical protein
LNDVQSLTISKQLNVSEHFATKILFSFLPLILATQWVVHSRSVISSAHTTSRGNQFDDGVITFHLSSV